MLFLMFFLGKLIRCRVLVRFLRLLFLFIVIVGLLFLFLDCLLVKMVLNCVVMMVCWCFSVCSSVVLLV